MDERHLFLRVVDAGSFRAVAEEMGLNPSSVSRRVSALEARLGVRLLQRSTVRTVPTEDGERYAHGLRDLLGREAALDAEVSGRAEAPGGHLRVAAPVDFGTHFVVPVLVAMRRDYPGLTFELALGSHYADIVEQRLDVAVRIGRMPDSALVARRLASVPRVLVASRGYADTHGLPDTPGDLAKHGFVLYRPGSQRSTLRFGDGVSPSSVEVSGAVSANSLTAIHALVEAGMGLHLGPLWAFKAALDGGSLVRVLPGVPLQSYPLHAVTAPGRFRPARTRHFIERFSAAVRAEDTLER